MTVRVITGVLALALAAACAPAGVDDSTAEIPATASGVRVSEAAVSELAGTSWQLVKIMGMDDSVAEPVDGALYTLEFQADGSAAMRADCNRGTATWTSESAGRLQFGRVASTRAMCPPDSLSEKYLAQFQWVRSYVMENGHLFLATMADGAIIEFEPAPGAPLAATVLGDEIRTTDAPVNEALHRKTGDFTRWTSASILYQ